MTTPFPLGRHVNHDARSLRFPFRGEGAPLTSVRHERLVPIWDQGNLGSCTGHAAVGCLGTRPVVDGLVGDWDLSQTMAVSVYSAASMIDPFDGQYPPTDTGSDGLSVAKILHQMGLISGYRHAFSFNDALDAIQKQPIIVGTWWYSSMFYPDNTGLVHIADGSSPVGGHEYIIDELNVEEGLVGCTNSWGTGWGDGGRFYMAFETLERLLSEQGDATVFVPLSVAPPTPEPAPVVPEPAPEPVDPEPVVDDQPVPCPNCDCCEDGECICCEMAEVHDPFVVMADTADVELWSYVSYWATKRGWRSRLRNRKAAGALREWAKAKSLLVP